MFGLQRVASSQERDTEACGTEHRKLRHERAFALVREGQVLTRKSAGNAHGCQSGINAQDLHHVRSHVSRL